MAFDLGEEKTVKFDIETEREKRARFFLLHNVFQVLWDSPQGKRTSELSFVDGTQIFLGLTRQILLECEHLVLQGKIWNFKWRQEATLTPLSGLVTSILSLKGVPMNPKDIASILSPWRNQPADVLEEMVTSFLTSRLGTLCFRTDKGLFGLFDWLPKVEGLSLEEAIEQEFWGQEEFAQWMLSLIPENFELAEAAKALLDSASMALSHRELLFALWVKSGGQLEILPTFLQLLGTEGLQPLALGYMMTDKVKVALTEILIRKSDEFRQKAHQKAKVVKTKKLQQLLASQAEYKVSHDVGNEIAIWLETQPYPVPLTKIAEQVLEVLPTDPDYEQILSGLFAFLSQDKRFVNLGGNCWWLSGKIPSLVNEIPTAITPPPPPTLPRELTGQFDLVLPLEGIDEDLRRFVEDPNYEEVGEPEVSLPSKLKPARQLNIPVTFPHFQAGTLKIRRIDLPFFDPEPNIQFLHAIDDTQKEIGLWVNLSIGLCFGLSDWYLERGVEVGGIVRLEKTKAGVRLNWTNRYDHWLHIPRHRLNELLQFASHETIRKAPLITLVQSLITQHPRGVHFLRLWSELNVLRRTTKIALASILCSYPMFTRIQGQEGYWALDFTKLAEGIRAEKLAYL